MANFTSLYYCREIMDKSCDIILIMRPDGTIIDANKAAINAYGYSLAELKALTLANLTDFTAMPKDITWQASYTEGPLETIHCRKDGSTFPVEVSSQRLIFPSEHLLISIIHDITERIQIKELLARNILLEKLASTDRLTGLWNRQYFENTALDEIERANRYQLPLSLILFDIDYFKQLNDSFGHQTGDNILIAVANLILKQLRINDIFARWGGDEFIILLPNTNAPSAHKTAEKIRGIIETSKIPPVDAVTLSLGVTEYLPAETLATWISRADSALYLAKKSGRNTVRTAIL